MNIPHHGKKVLGLGEWTLAILSLLIVHGAYAELPSRYVQVDYIQSTGSQWINSGYAFTHDGRIEIDFQLQNTKGQQCLFGSAANALVTALYINGSATSGGKFTYTRNNDKSANTPSSVVVSKDRRTVVLDAKAGKFTVKKGLGAESVLITDVSDLRLAKAQECGVDFAFRDYAEAYRYIDANRESTMKVIVDVDC